MFRISEAAEDVDAPINAQAAIIAILKTRFMVFLETHSVVSLRVMVYIAGLEHTAARQVQYACV